MFLKKIKIYIRNHPRLEITVGIILILVGLFALITPFTPGTWLALIGFELLNIHFLFLKKLKKKLFRA